MKKLFLPLGLWALSFMACYTPDPFTAEYSNSNTNTSDENTNTSAEMGKIFSVNGGMQTCNPSASQDTVNYPASMLWLNFGKIGVNKPDGSIGNQLVGVHTRLTVSDTANDVKWLLETDSAQGECEFQDPEWSTHPNFIVALRGYDVDGSKGCNSLDYGIFAVRMSDKKKFWFFKKNIPGFATPHLFVGEPDGGFKEYGDSSTVEGFFGSDRVMLTYVDENQNIVVAGYRTLENGKPKTYKLKKPSNRKNWKIDSPLISPNGWYVVYNMTENSTTWEAYLQYIDEDAEPIKIERTKDMMSEPAQPHWYMTEKKLFVVWSEFPAGSQMLNKSDLTKSSVQDGSAGRTVMRCIRSFGTSDESVVWDGDGIEIAPVPMTGGITPDGKFLATGTNPAYLLKLP